MPLEISLPRPTPATELAEPHDHYDEVTPEEKPFLPGQMFQMDFGFVRNSDFSGKDDDGKLITSFDGYTCYLLIIDRKTRRLWGFMMKGKTPPIDIVRDFLNQTDAEHRQEG